jgi:hypothetical protein
MRVRTNPSKLTTRSLLAMIAAAGFALPASAQVQSGESGRALDANRQVGSGGINQPAAVIDFAVRNAVITGNVPDGREFRGDVGYSAPTEFRGQLGSDDLFRFNARSLGSSLPVASRGGAYNIDVGSVVVPRTTGAPTYYSTSELLVPDRLIGPSGGSYSAAQIASGTARIVIPEAPRISIGEAPDGRLLEVSASALLGLRELERPRMTLPEDALPDLSQGAQLRIPTEFDPTRVEPEPTSTQPLDRQIDPSRPLTTMVDPGLTLGQQLTASRLGADTRTFDQKVADIERAMFRQLGTRTAAPGDDVYLDVLRAMRGEAPPKASTDKPTQDLPELEAPTIEELEKAEQERRRAVEAAAAAMAEMQRRQQPEQDTTDRTPRGPAPHSPIEGEGSQGETDAGLSESLEELLGTLGEAREMPRLATLAGDREDRINRLMRDAEADMAAEKFFDAEAKYRQVLIDAPQTPLASVGQIHAQLGAAMIKSASYNLRKLFEQHPELIGVRYDPKLMPPQKRLEFVHGQIMQELRESPRGETALVLAYLGYQINSRQIVRYGLSIAESRSPQDPLLPLLQRIWLNETAGTDAAAPAPQGRAPAPAPTPANDAADGQGK